MYIFVGVMAGWIDTLMALMVDWGYWGMLLAAFMAGSIIPLGSEVIFVVLLRVGLDPWWLLLSASVGNTLGGMTCYWVGSLGRREWISRYLGVSDEKLQRADRFLAGRGAWMAFFAFLPYVGEAIAVALGLMRSNKLITTSAMFLGKVVRYAALWLGYLGVISL